MTPSFVRKRHRTGHIVLQSTEIFGNRSVKKAMGGGLVSKSDVGKVQNITHSFHIYLHYICP